MARSRFLPHRLAGHPRGLFVLVMTETWAQFSYFGMQAMLVYYMTKQLGFDHAKASVLYGTYTGVAYFTPFLGGILADRLIGRRASVIVGGTAMAAGHLLLTFDNLFFPALALVALGNGAFVAPLAAQVGALYPAGDERRDRAYSFYYMGINLGSFLAPLICGGLGELFGWDWGFAAAGVGMAIGLAVYLSNQASLPVAPARPAGGTRIAFTAEERRRTMALIGIAAVVVLFRVAYEQSGNVLALWVDRDTDRVLAFHGFRGVIPATWFQSLNPLLIIGLTPVVVAHWARQARDGREPSDLQKMVRGGVLLCLAYGVMLAASLTRADGVPVSPLWACAHVTLLTLGELYTIPIGLSLFSRLAPAHSVSIMFGLWYLAKFAGSFSAGLFGAMYEAVGVSAFFALGMIFAGSSSLGFAVLDRRLARLMPVDRRDRAAAGSS